MKFSIHPRRDSYHFQPNYPFVWISIQDPIPYPDPYLPEWTRRPPSGLERIPNCLAVCQLWFWDTDPYRKDWDTQKEQMINGIRLEDGIFSVHQANEILDFFLKWEDQVEHMAVHCEAGISRSSGTAAALEIIANGRGADNWIYQSARYCPNSYVYRTILQEAEKRNLISIE